MLPGFCATKAGIFKDEKEAAHYHGPEDLKILKDMRKLAPKEFSGFVELDKIVGHEDDKIPLNIAD